MQSLTTAKVKAIVVACADLGNKYLPPLLKEMLDRTDDALFEMVNKTANNNDQAEYFGTMRELRRLRPVIEEDFSAHLKKAMQALFRPKTARVSSARKPQYDLEALSLLDEDDLEESLAVKGMVDKVYNRNQQTLDTLQRRFEHVFKGYAEVKDDYPLAPKVICDAFDTAIRRLDADMTLRLTIYKYFDRHVISNLGPLYEALNQVLINEGILPKLSYKLEKSPQAPVQQKAAGGAARGADAGGPTGQGASGGTQSDNPEAMLTQALQELFSPSSTDGYLQPLNPAFANDSTKAVQAVDIGQLVSAFSSLQSQFRAGASLPELKSQLAGALDKEGKSGTTAGVRSRESNLIDFVAILFEYIFDDPTIPSTAKSLIGRLQIPLIKTALMDQSLLVEKSHPARLLLNRLAQSCMGYEADIPIEESLLLIEIEKIVERIIDGFEDDISIFTEALQAFNQFMDQFEQEGEQATEVLRESCEAEEQTKLIHAEVDETIRRHVDDIPLPKAVVTLLTGPWRDVLVHTGTVQGMDSLQWDERGRFVKELVRSVIPKESTEERKHLAKRIPHLIRMLRQGLEEIGINGQTIIETMDALENLHMAILQPSLHRAKCAAKALPASSDSDGELRGADEALDLLFSMQSDIDDSLDEVMSYDEWAEKDESLGITEFQGFGADEGLDELLPEQMEFIEQARELEAGRWYLLEKDDGNKVRCKLVWKSELMGDYVFADWRHKVVAEYKLKSLTIALYEEKLTLLEQTPLLDRAIGYALSRFQKVKESMASTNTVQAKASALN